MRIPSLGSLTALAVLCTAPAVEAAVVLSSTVVNINLPTSGAPQAVNLDLDNDGTQDFQLTGTFGNASVANLKLTALNGNEVAIVTAGGLDFVQAVGGGATVDFGLTYSSFGYLFKGTDNADSPSLKYGNFTAGVAFQGGDSALHFGWIQFNFPGGGPNQAVRAAYEDLENTGIVTPVPEPWQFPLATAVSLAALAAFRRRSK